MELGNLENGSHGGILRVIGHGQCKGLHASLSLLKWCSRSLKTEATLFTPKAQPQACPFRNGLIARTGGGIDNSKVQ